MAKKGELNIKQKAFADEYIICGNAYKSAITVGYSNNYAKGNVNKLLENVSVKAYMAARMEEIKSEKVANQQEVLEYLTAVMRGEIQDEVLLVVGDEMGTEVERHEKRSDTVARTKAAELLGKRYAMWTERQQIDANVGVQIIDDTGIDDE